MVDIGEVIHPEPLPNAAGKGQVDMFAVGVLGQGRAQQEHIRAGNAVLGAGAVRIVVRHLFGQGPVGPVVPGVVHIVLIAAAVPGGEGDVEIAALVQPVVHHGGDPFGDLPVQLGVVFQVAIGEYRRGRGSPGRRGRAPAGAGPHGAVVVVLIEIDPLDRGIAPVLEHRIGPVRQTVAVHHYGREKVDSPLFQRRVGRRVIVKGGHGRAVGVLGPARAAHIHPVGVRAHPLVLDAVVRVVVVDHVQGIAIAHGQVRPGVALGIRGQAHPPGAGAATRPYGDHGKGTGKTIDLGQHHIISRAGRRGAAHVRNEDIVAVVDRHPREPANLALGTGHRGRIVDHGRAGSRQPGGAAVFRVGEVHVLVVGPGSGGDKGVDHPRIAPAVDLQIQGREGIAAPGGQGKERDIVRDTDRGAKGSAAVETAGVLHPVDRGETAIVNRAAVRRGT